jgi:hypothetical protein
MQTNEYDYNSSGHQTRKEMEMKHRKEPITDEDNMTHRSFPSSSPSNSFTCDNIKSIHKSSLLLLYQSTPCHFMKKRNNSKTVYKATRNLGIIFTLLSIIFSHWNQPKDDHKRAILQ